MRVRLALIPLVAAAALLSGCTSTGTPTTAPTTTAPAGNGVAALSADEIVTKAKTALAAAKSFHIKGGSDFDGESVTIDATFAGKDWAGTIDLGGLKFDVIVLGTDIYMKGIDQMLQGLVPAGQQANLAAINGKWVKLSSTTPGLGSMADSIKIDDLVDITGTLTKGDAATVNGTPAISVVSSDKSKLFVATEGEPYPLQAVDKNGAKLDFSQFNSAPAITAPAAADTFDLSKLMGG